MPVKDPYASIAEAPQASADPYASIAESDASGKSTEPAAQAPQKGIFSRAWQAVNTPIAEFSKGGRKESEKLESLQSGPTTLADVKWRTEHPVQDIARQYLAGVEQRASDLVTPLTAVTAGIGAAPEALASRVAAIPGAARVGKILKTALPVAFGGQGATQVAQAALDSKLDPDTRMRMALGGGAALTGAAAAAAPSAAEMIRPGTRATKELVKDTQAENATEADKASSANAKNSDKRAIDLKKHFDKSQEVKASNEAAEGVKSRKTALQRGVKRLDPELKEGLEATRKKVNAEANKRYNDLADNLNSKPANPEFLETALQDAFEKIKGSDTETTILKDMSKKLGKGDTLQYEDLQGYRSEIGRELSKGNLPGDVFHAYKGLQEQITNEMQRIADANGQGEQFRDARDYYRRYAETFIDRGSPVRKSLESTERGGVVKALRGKDQSGIQSVAQFDPEIARRLNTVRGHADEAAGIRVSNAPPKTTPALPPKPATVLPKVSKIGPAEVQGANAEALAKRSDAIRNRGGTWANTFVILDGIRNAIHGNFAGIGTDIAVRGVFGAGKTALANMLERPDVVNFLTQPTPQQIAAIPPELRGDFPAIIKTAQTQGIKVSPTLLAAFGSAPKKSVASALQPVQ